MLHRAFSRLRYALEKHRCLDKHGRVVVAVSGGLDSVVMLFMLVEYNRKFCQSWQIHAVHVDPRFPNWKTGRLEEYFKTLGVSHKIIAADIYRKIVRSEKKCFSCSRARRRHLLEEADRLNIFNIALAHHRQDAVETLLLNIVYGGEIATCLPRQSVIRGRFFFIRPLYYFDKRLIRDIARRFGLPAEANDCPFSKNNKREKIRFFLSEVQKEFPDVYRGIFNGMFNIKRAYLP